MKRQSKPYIVGDRAYVAIYLDLEIYEKLEKKRGITNRSAYVGNLIEQDVNEKSVCEA
jgi:hypothetical protein